MLGLCVYCYGFAGGWGPARVPPEKGSSGAVLCSKVWRLKGLFVLISKEEECLHVYYVFSPDVFLSPYQLKVINRKALKSKNDDAVQNPGNAVVAVTW